MEIQGVALLGTDPLLRVHAARLVARSAAQAGLPLDVVRLDHRVRVAAASFAESLGPAAPPLIELVELAGESVSSLRPTLLLDDLRWRTWAALTTGSAIVLCPDAPPEAEQALAVMGFAIVSLPESTGAAMDDDVLWEFLQPELRRAGLDLPSTALIGPEVAALDQQVLLRAYVARAAETVSERFVRGVHHSAAVITDGQGHLWRGLSVEGPGGTTACAHATALSAAALEGAGQLAYVVGVRHPQAPGGTGGYSIESPCAGCKEALLEVAPGLSVIVRRSGSLDCVPVEELVL